jgi:hypothetical protein
VGPGLLRQPVFGLLEHEIWSDAPFSLCCCCCSQAMMMVMLLMLLLLLLLLLPPVTLRLQARVRNRTGPPFVCCYCYCYYYYYCYCYYY